MSTIYSISAALLFLSLSVWFYKAYVQRNRLPLPPGPPRKLVVGNIFDMPKGGMLPVLAKWKEEYGEIVYIEAFGSPIVVLNTIECANALLDGTNYSHRPIFTYAGELMGTNRGMIMMNYGRTWREHRKLIHVALGPEAIRKYYRVQEQMASLLLIGLLEAPQNFDSLFRLTVGRVVSAIIYGLKDKSATDEYISEAEVVNKMTSDSVALGAHLVDFLPFLKHLPKWMPFATFHQEADAGRRLIDRMIARPFDHAIKEIAAGDARPSFIQHILTDPDTNHDVDSADFQQTLAWTAGMMYAGGIETTSVLLKTFVLAMTLFPEKQTLAQDELDRVVGPSRLPAMGDRASLPYVDAIIKELFRWNVIAPLSVPRRTEKDGEYKGYFIPAGSMVLPNIWSMAFDSSDRPKDFIPERFLTSERPQDPSAYSFGFGRRICPGRQLADNSIFIILASILSVFRISKQRDELGNEIPVHPSFNEDGLVSNPESFKCSIAPRSPAAVKLFKPIV